MEFLIIKLSIVVDGIRIVVVRDTDVLLFCSDDEIIIIFISFEMRLQEISQSKQKQNIPTLKQ